MGTDNCKVANLQSNRTIKIEGQKHNCSLLERWHWAKRIRLELSSQGTGSIYFPLVYVLRSDLIARLASLFINRKRSYRAESSVHSLNRLAFNFIVRNCCLWVEFYLVVNRHVQD